MPISAFNTVYHSHGSERPKNLRKSLQPGLSRHYLLPLLPPVHVQLHCSELHPSKQGPYPKDRLPPAHTLQGGVQARGQCWHRNKWVVTGHECILTASRKNALNHQSNEMLDAAMVNLQPPYRAWVLYFISPGHTAAADSYSPLLPLSYRGEPEPEDCRAHVLTDNEKHLPLFC